jgi:TonB family protein
MEGMTARTAGVAAFAFVALVVTVILLRPDPATLASRDDAPGPAASAPAGPDVTLPPEGAAPAEPEPVRADPELREPRKLHHVNPVYPEVARRAGVEGTVVLECVIGTDGSVRSVKVLRSVPALDEAALEAARQWRYEPTTLRGRKVPVIMTVTINFRLD